MRVLHVVTLVDDRSSYGGPLSVALGHCQELQRRGHQPVLAAGWRGEGPLPTQLEGVPVQLFPVRTLVPGMRFAGLIAPGLISWLRDHAREFDVAHLHLARDLVPLGAAAILRRAGVPYVVQPHGMIRPDGRPTARVLDRLLTLPTLRAARTVLALTPRESSDLEQVIGDGRMIRRLRNGITSPEPTVAPPLEASPRLDVLFLARLHPRKRVLAFARAAATLIEEGVQADFTVVGPDDGDLPALTAFLAARPELAGRVTYAGAMNHEAALARLRRAGLFVLPSVDEPYPMTVLEALAAGVPVICTESCGIASTLREVGAAAIVAPDEEDLVAALRTVVNDPEYRQGLAAKARRCAETIFSLEAVVDELLAHYEAAASGRTAVEPRTLLWVTNLATPYRLPLWRELAQQRSLTVALLAETEPNRNWKLDLAGESFAVERLGARVLRASSALTLYAPSRRLHELIRQRPGALVMDGWESPAFLAAVWRARRAGVPVVVSYRSTEKSHRYRGGPVATLRAAVFRAVGAVVTSGPDSTAAVLGMGVPARRIAVGFNTVDVEAFASASSAARTTMAASTGHRFLYVGQLISRKNVTTLVESFARIRADGDSLVIVGTGPCATEIVQRCESLGIADRVVLSGHLDGDALLGAYAAADTLVLPSTEEVWGLVVNEALAAGLHVVVSDACGVSSSINGMPGVWIGQPTTEGLAQGMQDSRAAWTGPMADHPIRRHTPLALAQVVLDAVDRAYAGAAR